MLMKTGPEWSMWGVTKFQILESEKTSFFEEGPDRAEHKYKAIHCFINTV